MNLMQLYPKTECFDIEPPKHHHRPCKEDPHVHYHPGTPPLRHPALDMDIKWDKDYCHDFDCNEEESLNVEVYIDDELDVFFKDYIINNPFHPSFYKLQQDDVYNFKKALENFQDIAFKDGDYLVVYNSDKSIFSVYMYTDGEWISFRGKNAFNDEAGDVNLIFDEDDDD